MHCDRCILEDESRAELPLDAFLSDFLACDACTEAAAGPLALRLALDRLRQSAHSLRRTRSLLRQREKDLEAALEATAQYEARIENMERVYKQSTRELEPHVAVVEKQAETIRALSAPILEVGEGVVAMPIIGALDGERAALVTEALLARIHAQPARWVILDLTGLDEVDDTTAVAFLRVCAALRLLGARVVLCGLRSRVAQELVRLGADLSALQMLPTLRAALARCR
ncbi:STAS domain-containing protein [Polyangium fumosum]|nr:STAS domain-containing protein [Polyangium fumosum]